MPLTPNPSDQPSPCRMNLPRSLRCSWFLFCILQPDHLFEGGRRWQLCGWYCTSREFGNDTIDEVKNFIADKCSRCLKSWDNVLFKKCTIYNRIILCTGNSFNLFRDIVHGQQDVDMAIGLRKRPYKINPQTSKSSISLRYFVVMENISCPLASVTIDHKAPHILKESGPEITTL